MKKSTKAVLTALCAVLLVAGSIFGTLAYLTDKTENVTNTFTVGKVNISLDEAVVNEYGKPLDKNSSVVNVASAERTDANTYKLIPGHNYTKDPTVTVEAGSEECYVYVRITNGLGDDVTLNMSEDWDELTGVDNVYVYTSTVNARSSKKVLPPVFTDFTLGDDVDVTDSSLYPTDSDGYVLTDSAKRVITVKAYAVQKDGFNSAAEAWTSANFSD